MKIKIFVVLLFTVAVMVACSGDNTNEGTEMEINDLKELVYDYSVGNINNVSATITSHQLIVTDREGSKSVYDLPKEEDFFVSIAPFVHETHP